jgi:hypothetical protein
MEKRGKKIIYLQNILFLLFDKHCNSPEEAGEAVADAIIQASKILWPGNGAFEEVEDIRKCWMAQFIEGFKNKLNGGR